MFEPPIEEEESVVTSGCSRTVGMCYVFMIFVYLLLAVTKKTSEVVFIQTLAVLRLTGSLGV